MSWLASAARPGRTRGIGLELWAAATSDRERAGPTLSRGLREARALHSAERRAVQEVLYGLVRTERGLRELLGDDPLDAWLGWLVLAGLAPEEAEAWRPGPWGALRDRFAALPAALRHSLPDALEERLRGQLGPEEAERFWAASDARAPLVLRAHLRRAGSRERLAERLAGEGVATTPVGAVGLRVEGRANVEGSRSFRDGWLEVQDEGSQRLVELVPPGGTLLDLCAGAGGKALALADRGFRVTACDVRPRALRELEERAKRGGVRIATAALAEDGELPPALAGQRFDVVLVDAPCTGTGVLRRHPTDRWRWSEERAAALVALQGRLLERGARRVADGGHLVHATCSVDRAEDEDVVAAFLAAQPGWERVAELRTWPQVDAVDGFYGCVLRRVR